MKTLTDVSTLEFVKAIFWAGIIPFFMFIHGGLAELTAYLTIMALFYWFILEKANLAGIAIVTEWAVMAMFYAALMFIELLSLLLHVLE